MIRSSVLFVMAVLAGAAGFAAPVAAVAGPEPVVSITEFSSQISHDGRYVGSAGDFDNETADFEVVDRLTGAKLAVPTCNADHCWSEGFVRDNPSLIIIFEYGPIPDPTEDGDGEPENVSPLLGVYLVNTSSGARMRIDADSAGRPLVASWRNEGSCGNEWCDNFFDYPNVFIGTQSVSRSGGKVAFCTNYAQPKVPVLYVKDLTNGRLTQTGQRCPVVDYVEGQITRAPEISADGRVVHVRGDAQVDARQLNTPWPRWAADRLYFTATKKVRKVNGWGSMTRDGGTIFMRLGVPKRAVPTSSIRVGAYNVKTGKVVKLPGRDMIYGSSIERFYAHERASYRGRFVIVTQGTADDVIGVVDRLTGAQADITEILREQGYVVEGLHSPMISGNGTVVLVAVKTPNPEKSEMVAITGWESRLVR